MVLGSGLVARGFTAYQEDDSCLVFASGVSNSSNTDESDFDREANLLKKTLGQHPKKTFIYFSTCSIYDPSLQDSAYVKHKLKMESMVQENQEDYHIFRISNLAGKTNNPHTVLNFFAQHLISRRFFFLWKNASRNIIDLEHAVAICSFILKNNLFKNEVINIANPVNYPVKEIIRVMENILGQKGEYEWIEKGSDLMINTLPIQSFFSELKIPFDNEYLFRTLTKYYTHH